MAGEDDLIRTAETLPAIRLLVRFGSAARATSGPRSDIDVGLLLDDSMTRAETEVALGRAAGRPIDIVYLDDAPPQFRFEIAWDGKVLVERFPYAWADFRVRAILDWSDWTPTARMIHAAAIARLRERAVNGQT